MESLTITNKYHLVTCIANLDNTASEQNPLTFKIKSPAIFFEKDFNFNTDTKEGKQDLNINSITLHPCFFEGDSPEEVVRKIALNSAIVLGKSFGINYKDILNKVKLNTNN